LLVLQNWFVGAIVGRIVYRLFAHVENVGNARGPGAAPRVALFSFTATQQLLARVNTEGFVRNCGEVSGSLVLPMFGVMALLLGLPWLSGLAVVPHLLPKLEVFQGFPTTAAGYDLVGTLCRRLMHLFFLAVWSLLFALATTTLSFIRTIKMAWQPQIIGYRLENVPE